MQAARAERFLDDTARMNRDSRRTRFRAAAWSGAGVASAMAAISAPAAFSASATAVGAAVVGEDRDALAASNTVALQILQHGIRKHDARHVVAGEDERPFDRACRQHYLASADLPELLPRAAFARCSTRDQRIVVVVARDGGASEHSGIRQRLQMPQSSASAQFLALGARI